MVAIVYGGMPLVASGALIHLRASAGKKYQAFVSMAETNEEERQEKLHHGEQLFHDSMSRAKIFRYIEAGTTGVLGSACIYHAFNSPTKEKRILLSVGTAFSTIALYRLIFRTTPEVEYEKYKRALNDTNNIAIGFIPEFSSSNGQQDETTLGLAVFMRF